MRGLAWTFVLLAGCGRLGFSEQPPEPMADAAPTPDSGPPAAGLVAYWPFQSPNRLADVVGGNDASCPTNCPTLDGSVAIFNGTTSCLDVPGLQSWMAPAFTMSAWIEPAAPSGPIIAKQSVTTCPSPQLDLSNGHPGLVQLNTTDSTHNNAYTPTTVLASSQWHHVAVTWDGTAQQVFVDGVCDCTITPSLGPLDNVAAFSLGCFPGAGTFFDGSIDEVRVYDRVLALDEIAQLDTFRGAIAPTPQACAVTCSAVVP